jgi:hypothetical protein
MYGASTLPLSPLLQMAVPSPTAGTGVYVPMASEDSP